MSFSLTDVSLSADLQQFISDCIASGKYANAAEVVRESLQRLRDEQLEDEQWTAQLKQKLELASAQADRGEFVDPDEAFARIRTLIEKRTREYESRVS